MKNVLFVSLTILMVPFISLAAASKKKNHQPNAKLSTDIRFSGADVGGKYQYAGEGIATVENEKPMLDLIEPRHEFKDRLKKSVTQR